jgi:hypothetical protein
LTVVNCRDGRVAILGSLAATLNTNPPMLACWLGQAARCGSNRGISRPIGWRRRSPRRQCAAKLSNYGCPPQPPRAERLGMVLRVAQW